MIQSPRQVDLCPRNMTKSYRPALAASHYPPQPVSISATHPTSTCRHAAARSCGCEVHTVRGSSTPAHSTHQFAHTHIHTLMRLRCMCPHLLSWPRHGRASYSCPPGTCRGRCTGSLSQAVYQAQHCPLNNTQGGRGSSTPPSTARI